MRFSDKKWIGLLLVFVLISTVATGLALAQEKKVTPLRVTINVWGGYAPGLVVNNGLKANKDCVNWKKYGIQVEYVVIDDWDQKAAAFTAGKVDVMGTTVDFFANQFATFKDKKFISKAFLLHDWSKGGDGIVTAKNIKKIEDLKGKKIATTKYTPSHFFLLYLLTNSKLKPADIDEIRKNLIFADKAPRAAELFVAKQADAAVTWEPDLSNAAKKGNGHLLATTATTVSLIGDVLVVSENFAKKNPELLNKFVKAWFEGVEMVNKDPEGSAKIVSKALKVPIPEVKGMLAGLKLTNYQDNREFFGLDGKGKSHYEELFSSAGTIWKKEGIIKEAAKPSEAFDPSILRSLKP